ncbi:MAG: hypothetical protein KDI92_12010 [Xanthomonadales bacterium]|nr:hypothetical protein [Xanthomonadales bacterium]
MKKIFIIAISLSLVTTTGLAKKDQAHKQKDLPPGLEKKLERGGELPPGWEKKLIVGKPLDRTIYYHRRVVEPVDSRGLITVEIDGKLIRLYEATREIVEILK